MNPGFCFWKQKRGGFVRVVESCGGKVVNFAAFNAWRSCRKFQPAAKETADSRGGRHQCVQAEHVWTDEDEA